MSGRAYELWQPLLALAGWIDGHGANGLLGLVQVHALVTIEAGKEDQTPDHDEALLRILTEQIRAGGAPQAGEIQDKVRQADPATFAKWSARGVAQHLKRYGLATNKSHGRKVYSRVTLNDLRRIETAYALDLGLDDETE